jgi:hypothetical protein
VSAPKRLLLLSLCLPAPLASCATYNPHLTATPTAAHTTDLAVTADALVVDRGVGPQVLPAPDVSLRRGIGDAWDIGVRLFPLGAEFSARARLYRSATYELSLLPLFATGIVSATNADTSFVGVGAGLIALNGFRLGKHSVLTLGLRTGLEVGLNAVAVEEDFSAARWRMLVGGSVALDQAMSEKWSVSPGVVVLVPYDLNLAEFQFPLIQGGFSAHW